MPRFVVFLMPFALLGTSVLAATLDTHAQQRMLKGSVKRVASYTLKTGDSPSQRRLRREVLYRPDGQISRFTSVRGNNRRTINIYRYSNGDLVHITRTGDGESMGETRVTYDAKKRVEVRTRIRNDDVNKIKTYHFDIAGHRTGYETRYLERGVDSYKSFTSISYNDRGDPTVVARKKLEFQRREGRYETRLEFEIQYTYSDKGQLLSETRTKHKRDNQATREQRVFELDNHGNWIRAEIYRISPDDDTKKLTRIIERTIIYY